MTHVFKKRTVTLCLFALAVFFLWAWAGSLDALACLIRGDRLFVRVSRESQDGIEQSLEFQVIIRNIHFTSVKIIGLQSSCNCFNGVKGLPTELRPGETIAIPMRSPVTELQPGESSWLRLLTNSEDETYFVALND